MIVKKGTLIAIIRGVKAEEVIPIAEVLVESGITSIEVSLSEEELGIQCIQNIHAAFRDSVHLGAGTVIHPYQVDRVLEAGATYIITPGWDRELVRYIQSKDAEVLPGVFSPGDILQAIQEGVEAVKLFPIHDLGDSYVKNLVGGPFPNIHIVGVGGIGLHNVRKYFEAGCSSFAIGSDLVPRGASAKDLENIKQKAKEYVELLQEIGS